MEVLSFWFSFCGHNPFKVEHWYHYQCKMFVSHFLSPIHFCGDEKISRRRMKENIFLFVELSYFRLIFGNRSAKFLFYMFNFLFFGSDSFLWEANFRPSWAATHQCNICFIRISSVFLSYLFDFPCFVLLSPLCVLCSFLIC